MCQMIHHESANDANVSEEFSFEFALVPPGDGLRPSFRHTGESRYPSPSILNVGLHRHND
jgi:hypothetical protein